MNPGSQIVLHVKTALSQINNWLTNHDYFWLFNVVSSVVTLVYKQTQCEHNCSALKQDWHLFLKLAVLHMHDMWVRECSVCGGVLNSSFPFLLSRVHVWVQWPCYHNKKNEWDLSSHTLPKAWWKVCIAAYFVELTKYIHTFLSLILMSIILLSFGVVVSACTVGTVSHYAYAYIKISIYINVIF